MVAVVCAVFVGATALAVARTVAGPAALRPVPGSGEFRFSGKGSVGVAEGTVTTKVIPAAIKPSEPVRFIVDLRWTDTDQGYACPYGSGSGAVPGQTGKIPQVTILFIRPGHGEDLLANKGFAPPADTTRTMNGFTYACGPPNRITRTEGYDARVPGSTTASMKPGCYAPYPGNDAIPIAYLGPDATFEGTFATLSVGGVDCAAAATGVPAATAFTDTFSAAGQAKPHAVTVPATRTKAELTLRWTKPGDRFTVAGVLLVPKRKTSSVGQAAKLKITFFARTPTSLGVRITNLAPGKLTFEVVGQKVSGRATVRTHVGLKA